MASFMCHGMSGRLSWQLKEPTWLGKGVAQARAWQAATLQVIDTGLACQVDSN